MIIVGCSSAFHLSVENQKITILSRDVHQLYTGVSTAVELAVDRNRLNLEDGHPEPSLFEIWYGWDYYIQWISD